MTQEENNMKRLYLGMAVAVAVAFSASAADAQILDLSKYPDWAGQWRRVPDGGPPRYDPSKKNGLAQEAPLKPEYQKLLEASLKDQEDGGQGLVNTKCIPTGMPRMMSGVFSVEWVFTPSTTFMLSEYMIQQPRTYDQAGIPFAEDGQGIVKERIFLDKANPDILHDEITSIDSALTQPWTVMKSYRRDRNMLWTENNCVEGNMHVMIGEQNYFLSGDGYLMPTRKGQQPPDLRYFRAAQKRTQN